VRRPTFYLTHRAILSKEKSRHRLTLDVGVPKI
jgi:hypothetical protein